MGSITNYVAHLLRCHLLWRRWSEYVNHRLSSLNRNMYWRDRECLSRYSYIDLCLSIWALVVSSDVEWYQCVESSCCLRCENGNLFNMLIYLSFSCLRCGVVSMRGNLLLSQMWEWYQCVEASSICLSIWVLVVSSDVSGTNVWKPLQKDPICLRQ